MTAALPVTPPASSARLRKAAATLAAAAAIAGIGGVLGTVGIGQAIGVGGMASTPVAAADPLASLGLTHPEYNTGPQGRIPAEALGIDYEREPGPLDFLASVAS